MEYRIGEYYKATWSKGGKVKLLDVDENGTCTVEHKGGVFCAALPQLYPLSERRPCEPYKIGRVELTEEEVSEIYSSGKYIVSCSSVYQVFYSVNAGYYGHAVYTAPKGERLSHRGRFYAMTGKEVNALIGYDFLR